MKLSTKARYAVTSMLDVALHHEHGPITLSDISACQGISLSYLEQLFAKLRAAGLVEGVRGPGGGYRLAKSADKISIADIVDAVDFPAARSRGAERKAEDHCLSHQLWNDFSERLYAFLNAMTLDEFSERDEIKELLSSQLQKERRTAA